MAVALCNDANRRWVVTKCYSSFTTKCDWRYYKDSATRTITKCDNIITKCNSTDLTEFLLDKHIDPSRRGTLTQPHFDSIILRDVSYLASIMLDPELHVCHPRFQVERIALRRQSFTGPETTGIFPRHAIMIMVMVMIVMGFLSVLPQTWLFDWQQ